MARLLLFDIDNTLLWSGGAGSLAMGIAFRDLFGVEDGFKGVEFSGRTDRWILTKALRMHGVDGDYVRHERRFLDRYYSLLPQTLTERKGRLMPGFPELLEALQDVAGVRVGLATGNFSRTGLLKLAHFGIDRYFEGGGFGEDSEDRAEIVRLAVERLGGDPADALVIGDTPHDIAAARANGTIAVGVATGSNSVDELRESGADLTFEDFGDWRAAAAKLAAARTGAPRGGA